MADMALIQGAVTGLKAAADIAKGFLELKSIADVQGKVIVLVAQIIMRFFQLNAHMAIGKGGDSTGGSIAVRRR